MAVKDSLSNIAGAAAAALRGDGLAPERDAIAVLKADHENVKHLFEEVLEDKSSMLAGKRATIDRILAELELHAKLEESLFYPAVKQKSKKDTEDRQQVLEAYEEHGSMKDLMRKIKRSTGRDETLRAKVQVLSEIVEHHVEEEESELFPEAQRLLGERKLQLLGAEFTAIKERVTRRQRAGAGKKRLRVRTVRGAPNRRPRAPASNDPKVNDAHGPRTSHPPRLDALAPDAIVRDAASGDVSSYAEWLSECERTQRRPHAECVEELMNALARGDVTIVNADAL